MNQLPHAPGAPGVTETCWLHDTNGQQVRIIGNVDTITQAIQANGQEGEIVVETLGGQRRRFRGKQLEAVSPGRFVNAVTGQDIHDWSGQT